MAGGTEPCLSLRLLPGTLLNARSSLGGAEDGCGAGALAPFAVLAFVEPLMPLVFSVVAVATLLLAPVATAAPFSPCCDATAAAWA